MKVCQRGIEGGEIERDREREKYIDVARRIRPDILWNGEDRTGGYVLRRVKPETRASRVQGGGDAGRAVVVAAAGQAGGGI